MFGGVLNVGGEILISTQFWPELPRSTELFSALKFCSMRYGRYLTYSLVRRTPDDEPIRPWRSQGAESSC
jgi:hypothetical protein